MYPSLMNYLLRGFNRIGFKMYLWFLNNNLVSEYDKILSLFTKVFAFCIGETILDGDRILIFIDKKKLSEKTCILWVFLNASSWNKIINIHEVIFFRNGVLKNFVNFHENVLQLYMWEMWKYTRECWWSCILFGQRVFSVVIKFSSVLLKILFSHMFMDWFSWSMW